LRIMFERERPEPIYDAKTYLHGRLYQIDVFSMRGKRLIVFSTCVQKCVVT